MQHENLVKLYGYCVEGKHRILVYNYLEDNSLAQTLLDMGPLTTRGLVAMEDDSLNGDYDPEEACKFLKTSLLCTQDAPKFPPNMSTVVKMLKGYTDGVKITAPRLISYLSELKI